MKCNKCGSENKADVMFCSKCGANLENNNIICRINSHINILAILIGLFTAVIILIPEYIKEDSNVKNLIAESGFNIES